MCLPLPLDLTALGAAAPWQERRIRASRRKRLTPTPCALHTRRYRPYKFALCFENSQLGGYVTEKIISAAVRPACSACCACAEGGEGVRACACVLTVWLFAVLPRLPHFASLPPPLPPSSRALPVASAARAHGPDLLGHARCRGPPQPEGEFSFYVPLHFTRIMLTI